MTVGRAYCNKPKLLGSTEWVKDALSESAKTHFSTFTKASGDSFEIGDGRILTYSSIGVQNSIF